MYLCVFSIVSDIRKNAKSLVMTAKKQLFEKYLSKNLSWIIEAYFNQLIILINKNV